MQKHFESSEEVSTQLLGQKTREKGEKVRLAKLLQMCRQKLQVVGHILGVFEAVV